MRVAIIHDFLMQMGGAEKVVEVFHGMFPEAPIYTSAYDADAMPKYYRAWDIRTSFMQRLPAKRFSHRLALMLYPLAFESFDLSDYDLVLSSSSAFAKGVITQPYTKHICYTHAPMRYAWSPQNYLQHEKTSSLARLVLTPGLHYLRCWDAQASTRVDRYIANSRAVSKRISKFYRRSCDIICPPVELDRFNIARSLGDYYIIVSRFVPYKRLDLAVEAFTRLGLPLKVVGEGRQGAALHAKAGPNVEFLGRVDDVELPALLAGARAYIMPGEEDFGIAPVEANACGRPVIAFAAGGALDSQQEDVTAVFFHEQTVDALCDAVRRSETMPFDTGTIQKNAQRFSVESFRRNIQSIIAQEMDEGPTRVGSILEPLQETRQLVTAHASGVDPYK